MPMALDIIVLIILGLSVIVAFFRGFIREVLTIAGLVGAAFAAVTYGSSLTPIFKGWISDPNTEETGKIFDLIPVDLAAMGGSYVLIFVGVLVALSVATHFIAKAAQHLGLGVLDRSLGILFGLVRGIVLIGLLYLPFHHLLSEEEKTRWFGASKSHFYVQYSAKLMQAFIPSDLPMPSGDEDVGTDEDAASKKLGEAIQETTSSALQPVTVEEEPPFNE